MAACKADGQAVSVHRCCSALGDRKKTSFTVCSISVKPPCLCSGAKQEEV